MNMIATMYYEKPSRIDLKQKQKALSIERRKVKRAAKQRARQMGSVWDE